MVGHRYWRVRQTIGNSNVCAASEIEFRDSNGVDLTGSGTPFASSYYGNSGSYYYGNAFDNNTGTIWASASGSNHYIGYDFGTDVDVKSVAWRVRTDGYAEQSPAQGFVEWSDNNSDWTQAYSFNVGSWNVGEKKTFLPPPTFLR